MKFNPKYALVAILLLAAVLRFWGLGTAEFYHDEGLKAFRSIGYLDYLQTEDQTTPAQWFKDRLVLPWWTKLSFHDHPPLFFLVQNLFLKVFGVSLFAARLPSVLSGLFSVYLLYSIAKKIFKKEIVGLFAALILAVNLIHVWISRSSLIESFQIFLILLNIYLFLRFLDDYKRWLLFGLTVGLAFLAKYTSIFLVPVYGLYFIFYRREIFKRREFYWTLALATLIFSPVFIYNFFLWKTVGHFDLQFSYLFSQAAPEWRASLGKIQDPFSEIFSNIRLMYSIPFILAALTGISYAALELKRSRGRPAPAAIWFFSFIFITLVLVGTGSAFRFISLYAPITAMLIALFISWCFEKFGRKPLLVILTAAFLIYELIFALDIFRTFPDFGIVQLDRYFDSEFNGFRSSALPESSNPHLNKIIQDNSSRIPAKERKPFIVTYDGNIGLSPRLWLFTRRNFYEGIPAFSADQFKNLMGIGADKFKGFDIYFVKASANTYLNPLFVSLVAGELENYLHSNFNLAPVKTIYGYNNLLMFTVYKFSL